MILQRAIYDQNSRLIVSRRTFVLKSHLTSTVVSRILVRPPVFSPELNSLVCHTVRLSVLNGCRRARGAGYRHGDRKGCLRGTREGVLNEIESWAEDFNKSPIFWLNGLAGQESRQLPRPPLSGRSPMVSWEHPFFVREISRTVVTCTPSSLPSVSSWHTNIPTSEPTSSLFSSPIQMFSTSHCTARWKR